MDKQDENLEKQDKTEQIAKDFEKQQATFIQEMNRKKKKIENKLKEAEEKRLVELIEKKERQRWQ